MIFYTTLTTPLGELKLLANTTHMLAILWENSSINSQKFPCLSENASLPIFQEAAFQLQEYFAKKRQTFTLPLNMQGTEFQLSVWKALSTIPYGQTFSYLDIAKTIGKPKAVRAVGMTIGKNPFSIIIPCHRVIGSNGK